MYSLTFVVNGWIRLDVHARSLERGERKRWRVLASAERGMLRHTIDSLHGAVREPVARSRGVPQASSQAFPIREVMIMSLALVFCYNSLISFQRERNHFESLIEAEEAKGGIAKSNSTLEDNREGLEERIRSMRTAKGKAAETLRLTRQILKVSESDITSLQSDIAKIEDELNQTLDTIDQVDASYYDELEKEIQKVKDETEEEQITLDEKVNNLAVEANMILSTKDDILQEVSQAEQDLVYTVTRKLELYARLLRTIEEEQEYLPSV
uniref:Uncharacterized protein n=1 Tax=Rhodosorus marinus TaxID=101924 RepID=A0A7S3EJJ3_9RHOD|mmetsp:Transcript_41331/g.162887  ORF Transcript_41331/g.162887 Transcript_41331/m.162887 type:complete len:268 (+) Transcript_41331:296-1099(+)